MTDDNENAGKGFARRVTSGNLDTLRQLLRAPTTTGKGAAGTPATPAPSKPEPPEVSAARAMFAGKSIKVPNWFSSAGSGAPGAVKQRVATSVVASPQGTAPPKLPSKPVWTKTLSKTDAQRQTGHPTGDLRLMKAGHKIDQTTFFRYAVFGNLPWSTQPDGHEEALGTFDVTILGTHHGVHTLTLSHRPEGHADQQNYTTGLRWGSLAGLLRNQIDVTKKELRLYSLPAGGSADFAIEIA